EARTFEQAQEHGGVVHLAVTVRDAAEVQRRLLQTEGCRLEALPVPEQFQDPQAPIGRQRLPYLGKYVRYLVLGEAVEELAHPDDRIAAGKLAGRVEIG